MEFCEYHPGVELDLLGECLVCAKEELMHSEAQVQTMTGLAALQVHQNKLVVEQARLEEERTQRGLEEARRSLEEERKELRTGLAEFSVDFQSKWYQISHAKEDLEKKFAELEADLREIDSERMSANKKSDEIINEIKNNEEAHFKYALDEARDSGAIDTPTWDAISPALAQVLKENHNLYTIYNSIYTCPIVKQGYLLKRSKFKPLNQISNKVALLFSLQDIANLQDNFPEVAEQTILLKGCGWGCSIWAVLGTLVGILQLMIVFSRNSGAPVEGRYGALVGVLMGVLFWWGVAFLILYFSHFRPHRNNRMLATIRSSISEFVTQSVSILGNDDSFTLNTETKRGRENPWNAHFLYNELYREMLMDFPVIHGDWPDHAKKLSKAKLNIEVLNSKRLERETRFKKENSGCERILTQYNYMCGEIRRVGSEIIKGLRVPDRKISALDCPNCGGPVTSESRKCPYCGVGLSY